MKSWLKPSITIIGLVILGLIPRLINLDHSLIGAHAWRQADTAAIARNFFEHGYNIFMPRIDWGGAGPGFVEMNFPIFPWIVSLVYAATGVWEPAGRLLSAVFSTASVVFLFLFLRRIIDERTAIWGGVFAAILPTSIYYGRAFMPESLMLAGLFGGLYAFTRWRQDGGIVWWGIALFAITITTLIKPTMLIVGLPLAHLAFIPERSAREVLADAMLWIFVALVFIILIAWYWHAHSLFQTYGNSFNIWGFGSDKWGNWTLVTGLDYWKRIVVDRLFAGHLALFAAPAFIAGMFSERRSVGEISLDMLMTGLAVFLFVVGTGNLAHEYYQLPLMMAGCAYIGKVYARHLRPKFPVSAATLALSLLLVFTAAASITQLSLYYRIENPTVSIRYILGDLIARTSVPSDLVVTVDGGNPAILYHAHRKGWVVGAETLNPMRISQLRAEGADYIAGHLSLVSDAANRQRLRSLIGGLTVVYDSDGFFIARL